MTQQEIQERNEQIALMLGWKNLNDKSFPEYIDTVGNFYPLKELKFHSDWNWLMEGYNYITKHHDIAWKITSKGVEIHNHGQGIDIWYETNCPKNVIKDAFLALSDFAKLYNEGKL